MWKILPKESLPEKVQVKQQGILLLSPRSSHDGLVSFAFPPSCFLLLKYYLLPSPLLPTFLPFATLLSSCSPVKPIPLLMGNSGSSVVWYPQLLNLSSQNHFVECWGHDSKTMENNAVKDLFSPKPSWEWSLWIILHIILNSISRFGFGESAWQCYYEKIAILKMHCKWKHY